MIKNVLQHIGGIENYGIISLVLFFLCFTGMLIWVLRMNKKKVEEASRMPRESGQDD